MTRQEYFKEPSVLERTYSHKISAQDVLVVTTLDGWIHGLKKSNGEILWGIKEGPVIKINDKKNSGDENSMRKDLVLAESGYANGISRGNTIFIAEPAGNGDLYYIEPGSGLKKFDASLKDLVEKKLGIHDNKHIFTGGKVSQVMAIDPLTGTVLRTFGGEGPSDCSESTKDAIFIVRTIYNLNIWDIDSEKILWDISFAEFSETTSMIPLVGKAPTPLIVADIDGKFGLKHEGKDYLVQSEFSSPVVSVFGVEVDENGNHLHKYQIEGPKELNHGYVGNLDGTFFLLSDKNFPHILKDSRNYGNYENGCIIGAEIYPACLVGTYLLESPTTASLDAGTDPVQSYNGLSYPMMITMAIGFILLSWPFWPIISRIFHKRDKIKESSSSTGLVPEDSHGMNSEKTLEKETDSTISITSTISIPSTNAASLQKIQVTDNILGYGSHGTVVLEGKFEGRKVAVKRMLAEFYHVADHEVKMLQESDIHPNVVRYYFKEHCEGFMYMALEYCAGTIADLVMKKDIPEVHALNSMSYPSIFEQIMAGISHLHSLNIVHRDIKPQNILLSELRKGMKKPTILISDFGLGKRLADDQSSFHNTIVPGNGPAGTAGWRAPECLLATKFGGILDNSQELQWFEHDGKAIEQPHETYMRITKLIDIFSAGCVFYFIVSNGKHPFGEKFAREVNIMRGNFRLQHLDSHGHSYLLKDLIKTMISKDPKKRPNAQAVLSHPYFWSSAQTLSFLQDISDRLESESKEPRSALLKALERNANKTVGQDWYRKFDRTIIENMSKYRKYDGSSVQDLLRAIRNKKHHYQDLPDTVKKEIGSLPDGFLQYYTEKFPNLVLHVYQFVQQNPKLLKDPMFQQYFQE